MEKIGPWLVILPFFLIVVGFLVAPAIIIIAGSFVSGGSIGIANYQCILSNNYNLQGFANSIWLSFFSALLGVIAGMFVSYFISKSKSRLRTTLIVITNITSNFAGVPLAFAFAIILGINGVVTVLVSRIFAMNLYDHFSLYSTTGLALIYLYFQIPLSIILTYPAFYGLKREWREAAENLGASPRQFWLKVGMPIVMPAAISSFVLLFANAFGAYATP